MTPQLSDHRLELHEILCSILGSRNVYFQPPESVKLKYPAIVYTRSSIRNNHADDKKYRMNHAYQVTLIDPDPDSPFVDALNSLDYCSFDTHYTSDRLNHDVFTLYYK